MNDFLKYCSYLIQWIQLKYCEFYSMVDRDRPQTIRHDLEQERKLK
jgi:hypothetical protein